MESKPNSKGNQHQDPLHKPLSNLQNVRRLSKSANKNYSKSASCLSPQKPEEGNQEVAIEHSVYFTDEVKIRIENVSKLV